MAMKLLRGAAISVVVFGTMIAAASCGKTVDGTDSNTHWLDECDADADCGNLSCLCGVCSSECSDEASCAHFGSDAVCAGACSTTTKAFCVRGTQGTGGEAASGGATNTGGSRAAGGSAGSGGSGDVPDSHAINPCAPMDAGPAPVINGVYPCGPAIIPTRYHWDGRTCAPTTCCAGSDCVNRYETAEACDQAHSACYAGDGIGRSCTTNADCVLTTRACCFCGETTVNDVIAIRSDSEPGWTKTSCAENQGECRPCVWFENPTLSAICLEGECKVLDVAPFNVCDGDAMCTLEPKSCCDPCTQTPSDYVAVSIDDSYLIPFRREVCGATGGASCDAGLCSPPQNLVARCDQGRCYVGE
jgi:hypothetical protein